MRPPQTGDETAHNTELRKRAEERLRKRRPLTGLMKAQSSETMLQELRIHQVELEMQNEELRNAQRALTLSRNNYYELYEFAPVAYFTFNEDGVVLEANLAATELLGLEKKFLINKTFLTFLSGEDCLHFSTHLKRVARNKFQDSAEFVLSTRDARPIAVRIQSQKVEDQPGKIRTTMVDISATFQAQRELRNLNEALESKVRERTAVAENQAVKLRDLAVELTRSSERERKRLAQLLHDHLQQLMTAAKIAACQILRRVNNDPLEKDKITESVHEVENLLVEAIDASRTLTVQLCPPVLYEAGLYAALEWLCRSKREKYHLKIDLKGDRIRGSANETDVFLLQAARELLLNVVKHAPESEVTVVLEQPANRVCLRVIDQGPGFDPGICLPQSGKTHFGLFYLKERTELLGGRMDVESAPGKGTKISILLPYVREIPGTENTETPLPPGVNENAQKSNRIRVIVCDDHRLFREGVRTLLGLEARIEIAGEAENGEEAVRLAESLHPDVILMDVNLSGLNGIDATREITARFPRVRVIGLSFHDEKEIKQAMRNAGAAAYVSKSDAAEDLIKIITSPSQVRSS